MSKGHSFAIIGDTMTNLDYVLPKVTRPARYTGGEWNSITKDWDAIDIKIALAYPDIYEIGMSNLGLGILYDIINREPDTLAERVYAPWVDMEAEMRNASIPLFSLESRHPLKDFDIIGFSLSHELTYTNVLNMLDLAAIPVHTSQRNGSYPLIVAGGSCALNPEPMSEFIDLFVLGEGEEVLLEILETFRRWKMQSPHEKQELLRELTHIPGIYVPSLYQVDYHIDGTIAKIWPESAGLSPSIKRCMLIDLPPVVTRPVIPYVATIHDRAAIEIQRGCTRGCRFCQAGIIYRPLRERPKEEIISAVDELLRNCGYNELSLLSLSTGDYSEIESLVGILSSRYREHNLKISLPSLRIDSFSLGLIDTIATAKKTGLTFAPEAGSERLRRVINKGISDEEILQTLENAAERGWSSVKLYFMLGLPTETADDIESIVHLLRHGSPSQRKTGSRALHIKVSTSAFVPKAHTVFQWAAQHSEEELNASIEGLRRGLKKSGMHLSWHDPKMSLLEGVMARGDRRLSKVIYRAWQSGSTFDAWSEHFNYEKWDRAFDEFGLDPAFYANRQRPFDEILPWAHIDVGLNTNFLQREYQRTLQDQPTNDCRSGSCNACGLESWHPACKKSN
jgi:radical SAM family uncharacterized protein